MNDTQQIDLRDMPMEPRHELLFGTIFALQPGEAVEITNDHDPAHLSERLSVEHPGRFTWTWLEQGPVAWRFRLDRNGQDVTVA